MRLEKEKTMQVQDKRVEVQLPTKHRVTRIWWNIDGTIYTFITARDDDRSKKDLIYRQKSHGKLNGVYGMIAKYPEQMNIEDIHLNLPKEVAESYRSWEIRRDKIMGRVNMNARENY